MTGRSWVVDSLVVSWPGRQAPELSFTMNWDCDGEFDECHEPAWRAHAQFQELDDDDKWSVISLLDSWSGTWDELMAEVTGEVVDDAW